MKVSVLSLKKQHNIGFPNLPANYLQVPKIFYD